MSEFKLGQAFVDKVTGPDWPKDDVGVAGGGLRTVEARPYNVQPDHPEFIGYTKGLHDAMLEQAARHDRLATFYQGLGPDSAARFAGAAMNDRNEARELRKALEDMANAAPNPPVPSSSLPENWPIIHERMVRACDDADRQDMIVKHFSHQVADFGPEDLNDDILLMIQKMERAMRARTALRFWHANECPDYPGNPSGAPQ